eukprot:COSAG06_NODE_47905_length_336_cov_0.548523_1_plen_54_part_01
MSDDTVLPATKPSTGPWESKSCARLARRPRDLRARKPQQQALPIPFPFPIPIPT